MVGGGGLAAGQKGLERQHLAQPVQASVVAVAASRGESQNIASASVHQEKALACWSAFDRS